MLLARGFPSATSLAFSSLPKLTLYVAFPVSHIKWFFIWSGFDHRFTNTLCSLSPIACSRQLCACVFLGVRIFWNCLAAWGWQDAAATGGHGWMHGGRGPAPGGLLMPHPAHPYPAWEDVGAEHFKGTWNNILRLCLLIYSCLFIDLIFFSGVCPGQTPKG